MFGGETKKNKSKKCIEICLFLFYNWMLAADGGICCYPELHLFCQRQSSILSVLHPCPLALGAKSQAVMAEENGTPLLKQDTS